MENSQFITLYHKIYAHSNCSMFYILWVGFCIIFCNLFKENRNGNSEVVITFEFVGMRDSSLLIVVVVDGLAHIEKCLPCVILNAIRGHSIQFHGRSEKGFLKCKQGEGLIFFRIVNILFRKIYTQTYLWLTL